jgi:hypothetical protein
MKRYGRAAVLIVAALCLAGPAAAQKKPETASAGDLLVPLKVEFVVSEFDGTKKITSLPYTMEVSAVGKRAHKLNYSRLRMGVQVPVLVGGGSKGNKWQYTNVGTNIDCSARAVGDGAYQINFNVERSSTYTPREQPAASEAPVGIKAAGARPILRRFRASTTLLLRDGQSNDSTLASDPFNGHVMRIAVTMHVMK